MYTPATLKGIQQLLTEPAMNVLHCTNYPFFWQTLYDTKYLIICPQVDLVWLN